MENNGDVMTVWLTLPDDPIIRLLFGILCVVIVGKVGSILGGIPLIYRLLGAAVSFFR